MSELLYAHTTQVGNNMINVPTEHQYKSDIASEVSFYTYRRLTPLTEPVLALNGTCISEFEITPSQVFNLSKSFLEADITFPAPAAGLRNVAHTGFCAMIDQIEFLDASGKQLVWIQAPQYYTKVVWPPSISQEDFLSNSIPNNSANEANSIGIKTTLLNRSNVVPSAINGGGVNDDVNAVFSNTVGPLLESYTGVQHGLVGGVATALFVRLQMPLSQFYGTLFACNKDLYFGQTTTIRITWNQAIKMGYTIKDADPNANTTANLTLLPTIQNDRIRLAQQANPISAESIKQDVNTKGIELCVPFVWTFKYVLSGAGSNVTQSFLRKINKNHGQRLLRVWTSQFNSQADGGLSAGGFYTNYCQNENFGNDCFSEVWSQLDGNNLQESNLLNSNGEVYEFLQQKIDGSAGASVGQYLSSAYMLNDFTPWKTKDFIKSDTIVSGLSLSEEREYAINFKSNQIGGETSNLYYMFVVCQRLLTITREGVMFA